MGKQQESDKKIVLTGQLLISLGTVNLNNRIYENNENLRKAIDDYNDRANKFGGFGEFGYPETFDVSFKNVSHSVKNLRIDDNSVVGDVTVLNTTKGGRKLAEMLDRCVFRPRAAGMVLANGEVVLDRIFAFDAINKEDDAFAKDTEALPNQREASS